MTGLTTEYSLLMSKLYSTNFISLIKMDENREWDGKELRDEFGIEKHERCSVLELMLGCAIRVECFMCAYDVPDRTSLWFQKMLESLGLSKYTNDNYDEAYVNDVLERFIMRKYAACGKGGLFTLQKPIADLRDVEIWYQLNWYVNEMTGE